VHAIICEHTARSKPSANISRMQSEAAAADINQCIQQAFVPCEWTFAFQRRLLREVQRQRAAAAVRVTRVEFTFATPVATAALNSDDV